MTAIFWIILRRGWQFVPIRLYETSRTSQVLGIALTRSSHQYLTEHVFRVQESFFFQIFAAKEHSELIYLDHLHWFHFPFAPDTVHSTKHFHGLFWQTKSCLYQLYILNNQVLIFNNLIQKYLWTIKCICVSQHISKGGSAPANLRFMEYLEDSGILPASLMKQQFHCWCRWGLSENLIAFIAGIQAQPGKTYQQAPESTAACL